MRAIGWCNWPGLLALSLLLGGMALPAASQAPDGKVTLKSVKYDEMIKALNGLKGQVVVVDFWADT